MLPDLSGLSPQEAALITDVLSQLSIGNAPAASIVPQSTPANGNLQNSTLTDIDLAAWTIEQELRGLRGPCPQAREPDRFALESYNRANLVPQGHIATPDAYLSDGFYGAPQTPQNPYGTDVSHGGWMHTGENRTQPQTADLSLLGGVQPSRPLPGNGTPQQPYSFDVSTHVPGPLRQEDCSANASSLRGTNQSACARPFELGLSIEEPVSHEMASPSSPAPAHQSQPMSLLKEMRERLRQQQTQQQVSESLLDMSASRASSMNGSMASMVGLKAAPAGQEAVSAGGGSPASTTIVRARRAAPSTPSSAAKAFTMLNARTSTERYGPESGQSEAQSFTPTKPPVKLPEPERSARLQQLYERTAKWRQRCEERYARERQDKEASELEGCTFTPKISTASHLIMQGKSPSEAYFVLSKAGTPTKHHRDFTLGGHQSPSIAASPRSTPARSDGGEGISTRAQLAANTITGIRACAASKVMSGAASVQEEASGITSGTAGSLSPPRPVVNGAEVGERLYQRALEQRARQEARIFRQLLEEEQQRRFTASVQSVSPRVYDPPEPPSSRHLPTGMEECTFHPRTRFRTKSSQPADDSKGARHRFDDDRDGYPKTPGNGTDKHNTTSWHCAYAPDAAPASPRSPPDGLKSRPKSAPHMRGAESRRRTATSPLFHIYGPSGLPGHDSALSRGRASSVNMILGISPDLDWEEFLARQDRFLVMREQKIALLEQTGPVGPRMCTGSKKLLREKELRQTAVETECSTGGVQGELSTRNGGLSPPQDRRVRTIMEMYKECTFQPQITRKAAARPSRQLEDFVEGGRARREEWRLQQQALKEMREAEDLTFKPSTFTKDAYPHIRPRISLRNPDAYLALVADKRKQREAQRTELYNEREARELQQCTFKPQTTPLPAYLIRRLQEQHLEQLQADQATAWEESSGGLGDIDYDTMKGTEAYYVDAAHESPNDLRHSVPTAGLAPGGQAKDEQDPKKNAFRDAYQRALQYATTLGRSAV
ncbi:hypothetical protein VaNZ11_007198 [Volvox africanus]|uniref:TPX2 C-terminal domain-containing protein n=1 Tax=Volvox africanus TaxID=51714 RepID=A0ABQ5S2E0_9CHLO|nr:hypothetical protein VaNZ11_007198 [Volvox africanus]